MTWEWYQKRIAEFFRRVPGARVAEDVRIPGKSGATRQLDVQIYLPMEIALSEEIKVKVYIHIIVDAKSMRSQWTSGCWAKLTIYAMMLGRT